MMLPRCFSTAPSSSAAKLVLRLRSKFEGVPLIRIKESLAASGNDFDKACELIEQQLASDGQKKASKVQNRVAQQGLITILQRPGLGAVMLELNCETDFVSRNPIFQELAIQTAASALLLHTPRSKPASPFINLSIPSLLRMPLLPSPLFHGSQTMDPRRHESKSISQALVDTVGRLGEKIEIRRGVLGYEGQMGSQKMVSVVHGVIPVARDGQGQENVMVKCGQIGALVALGRIGGDISSLQSSGINSGNGTESLSSTSASIEAEERELAQHIIGMQPANVEQLLEQPFLFSKAEQQQTVGQYLTEKQLLVRDFVRFNCGESLMTAEDESGDENEKQVAHA